MADENDLGELFVPIGADTSGLDAASPKVKKQLQDIANDAVSAYANATAKIIAAWTGVAASIYKVADAVKETIDQADELGKLSQSVGVSIDALGKLQYAAANSGVAADGLTLGIKHLADLLNQHGAFDQGTLIFSQLGIATKDATGQLRTADDVILQLADKFSIMTDGVRKTDLANQIFGNRLGSQLIPFLNLGAAGIKQLGIEGQNTGGIINSTLVKEATEFNDVLDRLAGVIKGAEIVLTSNLLPALKFLADQFDKSSAAGLGLQIVAVALGDLFKVLLVVIEGIVRGFAGLAVVVVSTAKAIKDAATGDWKGATDAINQGFQSISDGLHQWGKDTRAIFGQFPQDGQKAGADFQNKVAPPIIKTAEDIKNALANMLADNSVDPSVKIAKLNAALKAGQLTWAEYGADVDKALEPLRDFAQGNITDALGQNLLTAAQQMDVLNAAVTRGQIGFRQYDKMQKEVYDNQKSNLEDLATQTASTITAIFGQNKGAAIASAIINTAVGITKALSAYPPPFNFAMAALVAASGAAQLAAIKSTTQTGGGSSGGGSTSAASSSAAGQANSGASGAAAPGQTLTVMGINRNQMFSGDAVRDLAGRLIDFQKDGGKVVLAQ